MLEAGRYEAPGISLGLLAGRPLVEVVLVDMRERELTIKGQEILTADKVAIRVSIIVQFRVTDPKAAMHEVENYEERLYSDVQLAARRSLASMSWRRSSPTATGSARTSCATSRRSPRATAWRSCAPT